MHLGRAAVTAAAAIAAGQQGEQLLPSDFCTPECREYPIPFRQIRTLRLRSELIYYR